MRAQPGRTRRERGPLVSRPVAAGRKPLPAEAGHRVEQGAQPLFGLQAAERHGRAARRTGQRAVLVRAERVEDVRGGEPLRVPRGGPDEAGDGRPSGERAAAEGDFGDRAAQDDLDRRIVAQRLRPGPAGERGFDAQGGQQVGVVQQVGEERGERGAAQGGVPEAGAVRGGRAARSLPAVRVRAGRGGQPAAELLDEVGAGAAGDAPGQHVGGAFHALGEAGGDGAGHHGVAVGGQAARAAVAQADRCGAAPRRPVVREAGEPGVGEGGGDVVVPADQPGAEGRVVAERVLLAQHPVEAVRVPGGAACQQAGAGGGPAGPAGSRGPGGGGPGLGRGGRGRYVSGRVGLHGVPPVTSVRRCAARSLSGHHLNGRVAVGARPSG